MVAETTTMGSRLPSKRVVCPRSTFHLRFAAGQGCTCPASTGQRDAVGCSSADAESSHGVSRHGMAVLPGRLSCRRLSLRSGRTRCFNLCFPLMYFTVSF